MTPNTRTMRWLRVIAMLVLSGAALWWAYRSADVERVVQLVRSAGKLWVAVSLALLIAANVVHCGRWSVLLSGQGATTDFASLIRLHWIGLFVSIFLPAQLGLDAARIRYGRQILASRWQMVPVVVLDRIIGAVALAACACTALLVLQSLRDQVWLFVPPVLLLLISVGLLFAVIGRTQMAEAVRGRRWVHRIAEAVTFPLPEQQGRNSWHKDVILRTGLLAIVQFVLMASSLAVLAKSLSLRIPFFEIALGFPVIAVVTMTFPFSINGLGIREAMFLIVYRPLGLGHDEALALAAYWLGLLLVVGCLGAIPLSLSNSRTPPAE